MIRMVSLRTVTARPRFLHRRRRIDFVFTRQAASRNVALTYTSATDRSSRAECVPLVGQVTRPLIEFTPHSCVAAGLVLTTGEGLVRDGRSGIEPGTRPAASDRDIRTSPRFTLQSRWPPDDSCLRSTKCRVPDGRPSPAIDRRFEVRCACSAGRAI
jgi:hypothetical protein